MSGMIIRSKGFSKGYDGGQITFVGILDDGAGLVLYRYGVPHAVAIQTGVEYSFLFSSYAAYSATSYRIVRKFINEVRSGYPYKKWSGYPYENWSIRHKSVGYVRDYPDDFSLGWSDKMPEGYGEKAQREFEATLKPVSVMHPAYYGKLQALSVALQEALAKLK